ncbi:MAG: multidrug effflux MFS transporter, partial [Microlunatus sp.]|nr:multidrug effflux MFS transporter [Microlunatus sp.]
AARSGRRTEETMTQTLESAPAPVQTIRVRRLLPVLGGLIALGPLSVDMYLPALPAIQADLDTAPAVVQLTITGVLAGMALGQLIVGPLADAVGRRRPLIAGLVLYVLASLLCAVAPSFPVLGVARLLQGFAVSTAGVTATAMVRDLYSGRALARVLSRLLIIPLAAPVIAPTIGSAILHWAAWRAVFVLLAVAGAAMLIGSLVAVRETLPPVQRRPARPAAMLRAYAELIGDHQFLALAVLIGASMGALISYVSGAPFVFQDGFGLDQQQFGLVFGAGGISLIISSQLNAYLLRSRAPERILAGALAVGLGAVALLIIAAATGAGGLLGLLVPLWLLLGTIGTIFPNAPAVAMSRHGARAGSAAALIGASQFGVGAVAAPVVGALGNTPVAMAAVCTGAMIIAALALITARLVRR